VPLVSAMKHQNHVEGVLQKALACVVATQLIVA
jgi:hypothetical protein